MKKNFTMDETLHTPRSDHPVAIMVVVMLPEIHGSGAAVCRRRPVMDFLRGLSGHWVPAAPANTTESAPGCIRPGDGTETVLQVGEGLVIHGGESEPSSGPDASGADSRLSDHGNP